MWEQEREQKPPVYKLDNLAVGLTQLRNENILCDLLIHLNDGSTVWAHKAVVCAVSPYILQLCQAEQSKSQSVIYINLNHVNVTNESLHLIVNYMYGCEIVVSSENLQDMRALANVLQLEDLKESLSENFNVEDHDEATQHEKALAYNEASGLSTSIKVEPCEDIQDTSYNIISLSPNIERDYNKNNSTNHTDFDIKLNDADDMDDAEADDYDDTVGDIETPTKRRKKSMYNVPHQRKVNIEVVEVAVKDITSKKCSMKKAAEIHGLSKTTLSRYFHMFLKTGKVERPNGHFICGSCSKDCGTLSALQNHSILHQRDLYICPHPGCGKEFIFKAKLNRHFKCHLPASFLCENCGNYFKTKAILERHITTSHGAFERQFCCKICSKGFGTERYLQQHMLSHSDTAHQCEKCGKEFKRKFKLNQHVKLCHIYV